MYYNYYVVTIIISFLYRRAKCIIIPHQTLKKR